MDHLDLVRRQFGANATNYATSPVHAKGASLARLVDELHPDPDWRVLDIATAAGHTAFAVAPHVNEVIATDVTPEMLAVARTGAAERALTNITFEPADAEALPFDAASFDAATCRIAPHHFPRPPRFVAEVARVLRSGGVFGLVDNVVPDDLVAARFANDWEQRRDPSHVRCLSLDEWLALLTASGLAIRHAELLAKRMAFVAWVDNMDVAPELRADLLHALETAPQPATEFLRPELGAPGDQDAAAFHLTECIVVAVKG
ncbi:MAG: methyltransferase domain-containing protein [Acidimicrobiia bacterium]|nr:methyltransferase domain-containing protein [Acidimicrobiia bacterium]